VFSKKLIQVWNNLRVRKMMREILFHWVNYPFKSQRYSYKNLIRCTNSVYLSEYLSQYNELGVN